MELSDVVSLSEDAVAREVAGETVLLDLASGTYFGLNEIGSQIWKWLDEDDSSLLSDICARLVAEYKIEQADAQRDVLALADQLSEHGLLEKPAA